MTLVTRSTASGSRTLRAIRNYVYRMDVLERSMLYEDVTEIFVRVNSLGAKLRSSDLALAQITAKWRGALKEFQGFQADCAGLGFDLDLAIHLKALIAFATDQSRFHTVATLSLETLQDAWVRAKKGMEFAINFFEGQRGDGQPRAAVVAVSCRGTGVLRESTRDMQFPRRRRIGSDTGSASQTPRAATPVARLRRSSTKIWRVSATAAKWTCWSTGCGSRSADWTLPPRIRGRNQRSSLFKTMFLAFRDADARDWNSNLEISLAHTGAPAQASVPPYLPEGAAPKYHRTSREADDIANLAFISGGTNRKVSDKPPAEYLATIPEVDRLEFHRTQCVPDEPELLKPESYDAFLARRRELVADRLNEYLQTTGHLEPERPRDPQLRVLDERVETIELKLRALISDEVADINDLPSHVAANLKARHQTDERRNPGAVNGQIDGLLTYCDLRELQDILSSKDLWQRWATTFVTKEQLQARFGQLAALRNALRHSRTVDDITKKDGEAALLWFTGVLTQNPPA